LSYLTITGFDADRHRTANSQRGIDGTGEVTGAQIAQAGLWQTRCLSSFG
jgi:hypothetical protein